MDLNEASQCKYNAHTHTEARARQHEEQIFSKLTPTP